MTREYFDGSHRKASEYSAYVEERAAARPANRSRTGRTEGSGRVLWAASWFDHYHFVWLRA
jgi:hypothetical protein